MCEHSARTLVDSILELGAANMRLGVMMADALFLNSTGHEVMPTTEHEEVAVPTAPQIEEAEIDAAALVIEQRLIEGYELGFQTMLRLNFPRDRLREIARDALVAARASRTSAGVERERVSLEPAPLNSRR